ncbi:hypothetical protein [Curtobacterium sp. MCBD17_040]|nr:hypothetical protein [Curtobacterium sp. MCBD17_040]WIB65940.1 hypothetical protein DEI94_17655 [Curtobacterium sp. MCBD17_040]
MDASATHHPEGDTITPATISESDDGLTGRALDKGTELLPEEHVPAESRN